MSLVRVLSQKFETIMKDSPTQSLLFEDEALQCYKNNIKWFMNRNLTMKKLAKNNFSKPESKILNNINLSESIISTECTTNSEAGNGNSQFDKTELANEVEK